MLLGGISKVSVNFSEQVRFFWQIWELEKPPQNHTDFWVLDEDRRTWNALFYTLRKSSTCLFFMISLRHHRLRNWSQFLTNQADTFSRTRRMCVSFLSLILRNEYWLTQNRWRWRTMSSVSLEICGKLLTWVPTVRNNSSISSLFHPGNRG